MNPPEAPPPKRSSILIPTLLFVGINLAIVLAVIRQEPEPTRPPSVSGRVKFIGRPPPEIPIQMDRASATNYPGAKPMTRFHRVGADGGLADVFVYVKSGLTNLPYPAPTNAVVMRQAACVYLDYVIGAQAGQPIVVRNTDPILHNVHVTPRAPGNKEMNFAQMPKPRTTAAKRSPSWVRRLWERTKVAAASALGIAPSAPPPMSEVTFTLAKPELDVRLKCDVHPWEFGYVHCVEHPFFAVTDADGRFRFPQALPPGKYVIEAFHRKAGTRTQEIEVKTGEPVTVNFELTVPR
jgi:hypothetical protein